MGVLRSWAIPHRALDPPSPEGTPEVTVFYTLCSPLLPTVEKYPTLDHPPKGMQHWVGGVSLKCWGVMPLQHFLTGLLKQKS